MLASLFSIPFPHVALVRVCPTCSSVCYVWRIVLLSNFYFCDIIKFQGFLLDLWLASSAMSSRDGHPDAIWGHYWWLHLALHNIFIGKHESSRMYDITKSPSICQVFVFHWWFVDPRSPYELDPPLMTYTVTMLTWYVCLMLQIFCWSKCVLGLLLYLSSDCRRGP